MNQPLVSILMTSYNSAEFIGQAIESILDQTYSHWELLIADDCSQDHTREVIATFKDSRIKVYHNDQNLHYLRTRNKLVQYAEGEFITLLDSDDLMANCRLEKQLQAFSLDRELSMCGTQVKYIDSNNSVQDIEALNPLTYSEIKEIIKHQNVFVGSTIMVKTKIWREFGGYRDFFNSFGYEDYDLTSRIVEKYKAINLSEKLYYYRQYEESFTKSGQIYNPFKMHGHLLVKKMIKQRNQYQEDFLMQNDIPGIINFINFCNKPYVDDSSLIYNELMWSFAHKQLFRNAWLSIGMAMRKKPFSIKNFKCIALLALIQLRIIKE